MKYSAVLAFMIGTVVIAACVPSVTREASTDQVGEQISIPAGTYTNITPAELSTLLENNDFLLVNVHIPYEGNIPGTDLSIPYNDIESHTNLLPGDKAARLVIYCKSGPMADIAAEELLELGYTQIYNLEGGFTAWQADGFPLEN